MQFDEKFKYSVKVVSLASFLSIFQGVKLFFSFLIFFLWLLFLSLFSLDLSPDNFLRNLVCLLGHITLTKNSFKPQKAPYSRDESVIETAASFDAVSLVYSCSSGDCQETEPAPVILAH